MAQKSIKNLFSLALTSMLTLSSIGVTAVNADDIQPDPYDGRQLWTAQELLDFAPTVKTELTERCGDKTGFEWSECWWGLQEELGEKHEIYGAYQSFVGPTFIVTAINPSQESIRIIFHDEDMMEREMFGTENHYPIQEAYIAWFDSRYDQDQPFVPYFRNQERPTGMHVIFDSSKETESGWWPADKEITIIAEDRDVSQNTLEVNSEILFWVANYPSSVSGHTAYVNECLGSPNYRQGMECKLFYDKYGYYYYLPATTEEDIPKFSTQDATTVADIELSNIAKSSNGGHNITVPDTGYPTGTSGATNEFPWWAFIPAILGLIAAVWFFWPQKPKKFKKSPKKP